MNLSFAKDQRRFSKAVESIRGKVPMTEENIKDVYDALGEDEEMKEVVPVGETQAEPEKEEEKPKAKRTSKSKK